jgi:ClpP class serine protease
MNRLALRERLATRLFDAPLMIHPGKLEAITRFIGPDILGCDIVLHGGEDGGAATAFVTPSKASILGDRVGEAFAEQGLSTLRVIDGVAHIPIEGSLIHKGGWIGSFSGETSYQGIQAQVLEAHRRPDVKGAVFEVDSFGGEVSGAFDTADMIHDLSADKPTISIATDAACSAGYLMASAARQFVVPETAWAGSIGVVALHADRSQVVEKAGIKVTVLSAGKHKAEGNPFASLSEDVAKRWQVELEDTRITFAKAVAKYRGNRISFDQVIETEAATFKNGQAAVDAGLADAVMRPSEAFDTFIRGVQAASGAMW